VLAHFRERILFTSEGLIAEERRFMEEMPIAATTPIAPGIGAPARVERIFHRQALAVVAAQREFIAAIFHFVSSHHPHPM